MKKSGAVCLLAVVWCLILFLPSPARAGLGVTLEQVLRKVEKIYGIEESKNVKGEPFYSGINKVLNVMIACQGDKNDLSSAIFSAVLPGNAEDIKVQVGLAGQFIENVAEEVENPTDTVVTVLAFLVKNPNMLVTHLVGEKELAFYYSRELNLYSIELRKKN